MRSIVVAIAALMAITGSARAAGEKADPRALDYCKATTGTFVGVADCLPNAHLAVKTLDAFEKLYPEPAQALRTKCAERNEGNIIGTAACVTEAIRAALDLKEALPTGTTLDDPVFEAVSDSALSVKLDEAKESAKAVFPNGRAWGGSSYMPYK
ncbi:hypothetical protein B0E45_31790 [Sinorhizobium sp. A49]|uniref:hypothetical protein n=1 Tax=Sinorhizobium sp. A49 TaxID=1945861 RepID=UPI0009868986|nr:hypothetical protein [Sinorhizobium sp. A49]OOG61990.1 hypothetical protein B0E45_31790 [Sinorhizobium sp. A49]